MAEQISYWNDKTAVQIVHDLHAMKAKIENSASQVAWYWDTATNVLPSGSWTSSAMGWTNLTVPEKAPTPPEKVGSLFGTVPCRCEDGRIYYAILDDEQQARVITRVEYETLKLPKGWSTCAGCGGANGAPD